MSIRARSTKTFLEGIGKARHLRYWNRSQTSFLEDEFPLRKCALHEVENEMLYLQWFFTGLRYSSLLNSVSFVSTVFTGNRNPVPGLFIFLPQYQCSCNTISTAHSNCELDFTCQNIIDMLSARDCIYPLTTNCHLAGAGPTSMKLQKCADGMSTPLLN